jgi:NAD-dependent dihydropyrimidine dehydrogenase PreA subunit
MRAHDAHSDREILRGPAHAAFARAVWRAQSELALARARRATAIVAAGDDRLGALEAEVAAGQAALGGRVFRVPIDTLGELRRRIEQLDRRARRLGTGAIELADAAGVGSDGRTFVVLTGRAPVLAGWSLAAIVQHREGQATLCEHCCVRRRRVETFVVVRPESGELRQVGSGCLRDFLGGHDPDRVCRQAEYMALARAAVADADRSTVGGGGSGAPELPLEAFAACAARVVRAHGWVSAERARRSSGTASADSALRVFETAREAPDGADRALAAGALRWAQGLLAAKPELTAFERDALAVVTDGSVLTRRERGLVCALIAFYRGKRARSRHVGSPGMSIDATVLVERVLERPSARHGTNSCVEVCPVDCIHPTPDEPDYDLSLVPMHGSLITYAIQPAAP